MTLDNVSTEQRMALENAIGEYLDAGATPDDVRNDVEEFLADYSEHVGEDDLGTGGQDRESYTDDQDRESYTLPQ